MHKTQLICNYCKRLENPTLIDLVIDTKLSLDQKDVPSEGRVLQLTAEQHDELLSLTTDEYHREGKEIFGFTIEVTK